MLVSGIPIMILFILAMDCVCVPKNLHIEGLIPSGLGFESGAVRRLCLDEVYDDDGISTLIKRGTLERSLSLPCEDRTWQEVIVCKRTLTNLQSCEKQACVSSATQSVVYCYTAQAD